MSKRLRISLKLTPSFWLAAVVISVLAVGGSAYLPAGSNAGREPAVFAAQDDLLRLHSGPTLRSSGPAPRAAATSSTAEAPTRPDWPLTGLAVLAAITGALILARRAR